MGIYTFRVSKWIQEITDCEKALLYNPAKSHPMYFVEEYLFV